MSHIAIVVSDFNHEITHALLASAKKRLAELAFQSDSITVIHVPGAVEIPLTAQLLAKQNRYQAIICLGAVIKGDTNHYDYVCQQVSAGCQRVMLDFNLPVIFGVLTTENEKQAQERIDKGAEAVNAAMTMIAIVNNL